MILIYFFLCHIIEISLEILEFYDQKTHIISDRDRILSSILGSNIHTVSYPNTPNFTVNNPLVEKDEIRIEVEVYPAVSESDSVLPLETPGSAYKPPICPAGSVSPQSVHAPIMDGSESTFSSWTGFATPLYPNGVESTPSRTPRFERRDRSNSLNEYMMVDQKRTRTE